MYGQHAGLSNDNLQLEVKTALDNAFRLEFVSVQLKCWFGALTVTIIIMIIIVVVIIILCV